MKKTLSFCLGASRALDNCTITIESNSISLNSMFLKFIQHMTTANSLSIPEPEFDNDGQIIYYTGVYDKSRKEK